MKRYLSLDRRFAVLAVLAFVLLVSGAGPALAQQEEAQKQELAAQELAAQCRRTVTAHVVALNQPLYMNRLGANMPGGMIFALAGDVFPQGTEPEDQTVKKSCRFQTCTHGQVQLRDGKRPRPIVLRANEGDCLEIQFKNLLADGSANITPFTRDASVHVQGLSWDESSRDDGSATGVNPNSIATTGSSATYRLIAEREGPYMLYSTGDTMTIVNQPGASGGGDGGQLSQGLFGSVNVQPSGAPYGEAWGSEYYRSQVTELDLCLASQDGTWNSGQQTCQRSSPDSLPVLNYQALYPAGHPRAGLPILNMLCSQKLTPGAISQGVCTDNELVASDLTSVITGLSNAKGQPQGFPDQPVNLRPPSLRPVYSLPDRLQPYREFTIVYHESFNVVQAFSNVITGDDTSTALPSLTAAGDNFGINYGMGGLSAMVVSNRLAQGPAADCVDCKFEEFFLSSWAMGDPAMPVDSPTTNCSTPPCAVPTKASYPDDPSNVYHSYMSDHVKFRILHAGPDLHHLHHQHAHQWLGTPNSPDGDYLDSQSIGPGSAFTLEMVYNGSGNVNQTVGDSIFHCHFYPHFASGMWSLWRVHDVFEAGTILDPATGVAKTGIPNRALPDGQITAGTANVALVPLATLPMAPVPAKVQLQGVCSNDPTQNCLAAGDCAAGGACQDIGSRFCVYEKDPTTGKQVCLSPYQPTNLSWENVRKAGYKNPGYPFFVPGVGGTRAPHPPLDFAWACSKSGKICSPYQNKAKVGQENAEISELALLPEARAEFARPLPDEGVCGPDEGTCEAMDGGLPRSVAAQGSEADWFAVNSNIDIGKTIETLSAIKLPEDGSLLEKVAMATHSIRFHDTQLPDGRKTGVCSDNKAPCTAKDLSQCRNPLAATCTDGRINFVLNGLPPQQGAPYADPCINFDREGGQPRDLLTRAYVAADLQLDAVQNKAGWHYPQQRMISLWGDVQSFLDRQKPPEPLFMRVNSYDCMSYVLANLVPNVYELDDFQIRTPTDILGQHIHLVKFDVTSSDGAGNGWNYEDGTFAPNEVTERIHAINASPDGGGMYVPQVSGPVKREKVAPKYIKFFGPGPGARPDNPESGAWMGSQATVQRWYDDPLFNNFGVCSTDVDQPCTLSQPGDIKLGWIEAATGCKNKGFCVSSAGFCSDDVTKRCTELDLSKCAPSAICVPNQDRTIRTVFTHDHFGPSTHQQAGLYAGVVAEPKGSLWRENESGEIMGGFNPDSGENFPGREAKQNGMVVFDGGPTSWQAVIETPKKEESFREFLLEFQDSTLTYQPFSVAGNPFEGSAAGVCGTSTDEPCGFCSYTGICSDNGAKCQAGITGTTGTNGVTQALPAGCGTCNFGLTDNPAAPHLVACTPNSVLPGSANNPCYTGPNAVSNSCNFITGIPNGPWAVGAPIGSPGAVGTEVITFSGATNNFSVNYRNEPLFPRTTDFYSGLPLPGALGDLSYAFSSQRFCSNSPWKVCNGNADCGTGGVCQGRPSSRGSRCSNDLSRICQTDGGCESGGVCRPAGFCADNYNLCVESDDTAAKALCGSSGTACLSAPSSSPYPALTPDVESGDPFTPLLRAYAGDDVQVRTLVGAHINPHNFTLHGMNWLKENSFVDSGWRNTETMGISEHFELIVQVPPSFSDAEAQGEPFSDYMYQPGLAGIEQAAGNWGFLRAYESPQSDLYAVPGRPADPPPVAKVCPQGARTVSYDVVALTAVQALKGALVYNQRQGLRDPQALLLFNAKDPRLKCATAGDWYTCSYEGQPEPMVLRAAAGDCIQVTLYNGLPDPSTSICSVQQSSNPTPCPLGDSCGTNNSGVCGLFSNIPGSSGLYGVCSTDLSKTCRPDTVSLRCPPVTCTNGACSNTGNSCSSVTDCSPSVPVCIPAVGNYPAFSGSPSAGNLQTMGGVSSQQLTGSPVSPNKAQSLVSVQVGLRPGLLSFDPLSGDGTNAGFNPVQTAAPGGTVVYTWYAGHIDPDAKTDADRYIPIEFGAANLLGADPLNHYLRGLFAGLIVEPRGATWTPAWGGGAEAYVTYKEDPPVGKGQQRTFHEFAVFMQDDTNNMKLTNAQLATTKTNAVNFKSENLMDLTVPRFCSQQDCQAYLSDNNNQNVACLTASSTSNTLWCASNGSCAPCNFEPETPTFTARAGEQMRFRLLHGGGSNTNNVFELAGHNFSEAPYMTAPEFCEPSPTTHTNLHAAQFLGTRNLCGSRPFYLEDIAKKLELDTADLWDASLNEWKGSKMGHGPGNHFDVLVTKAGGPRAICGDYFYRSYTADHFNEGIWGLLKVVNPDGSACVPPPAESAPAPTAASAGR
ncbi:MAG TPA: hypothetical protein VKM72_07875 [Thermoanaerobaculia bacterium]|nr:hypothetical protein [Thermoanaerobaculia bacterium]